METGPDQTLGHSLWYSQSAPEPASSTGKSQTLYRNRNEKIEKMKTKNQIWFVSNLETHRRNTKLVEVEK